MNKILSADKFLSDVADHEMIVIRDDGLNRHIRFKKPGTSCMHFDLITWPGALCYTGDMGTYVFQRLSDMFEFFRSDRMHRRDPSKLSINRDYWTEKLIAIDGSRHGGKVKQFDDDKFTAVINKYRVRWMRRAKADQILDKESRRELWEAVGDEVLNALDDGSEFALRAAYEFSHTDCSYTWTIDDLFEHDFTEYTHSIVWCCYALAWGIEQYDAARLERDHEEGLQLNAEFGRVAEVEGQ